MISNLKVKSKCGEHVQALTEAQARVVAPLTEQVYARDTFNAKAVQLLVEAGLPPAGVITKSFAAPKAGGR